MKIKLLGQVLLLSLLTGNFVTAQNSLQVPRIFGDNMVLQRNLPITIWGWGPPGSNVIITLGSNLSETKVDDSGNWRVQLEELPAGGPLALEISSDEEVLRFQNVMMGDIWLASGQSNMDRPLAEHLRDSAMLENIDQTDIRLFIVNRDAATKPLQDLRSGEWQSCQRDLALKFSAIGYYFGKELFNDYNIPLGIIESTWGGTPIQSWIGESTASSFDYFHTYFDEIHDIAEDMNEVIRTDAANLRKRRDLIQNSFNGIDDKVHLANFDDGNWQSVTIPTPGIKHKNFVWLRKNFNLPDISCQPDAFFNPGNVANRVDAWINGEKVLDGIYWWSEVDTIPGSVFQKGENQVAMRIANAHGFVTMQDEDFPPTIYGIDSSWHVGLEGDWKYNATLEPEVPMPKHYHTYPSIIFNAMIFPIIPFGIKGIIWYQGESNTDKAYLYRELFPALIEDWRHQWLQEHLPFLYVQLANFMKTDDQPSESEWAELREAQLMALSTPQTGMAVIIDIGEEKDIHPKNKWDVGHRLALWAKAMAYDTPVVTSGPIYKGYRVDHERIIISFSHIGSGLHAKAGKLTGFAIAGSDKKFHWAEASILGDEVVVWSDEVPQPAAVRYAWGNNPEAGLYNEEGLPASPFRTDNWKGLTDDRTYTFPK